MIDNKTLSRYCADLLNTKGFEDYCPNGLQVEGKTNISKIICGVSANQRLIDEAILAGADAIFVHHGFFWKNEQPEIVGIKQKRIKQLLTHDINLFAYHLPLDAHPIFGNNIQLAKLLGIKNPTPLDNSLVWCGNIDLDLTDFGVQIEQVLGRKPLIFGEAKKPLRKIGWCTGAAQNYIVEAIDAGCDVYLSGEVSEQIPAIAYENNIAYISGGHHATERYGIQALCAHLSEKFEVEYSFIEVENSV